jgi:predicted nucleic acid-binding protein
MILLGTSVLSAVLRRKKRGAAEQALAAQVETLLRGDHAIALPGIVLQEILSGIADQGQREKVLRAVRQSFPVLLASEGDHLKAAGLASAAAGKNRPLHA